MRIYLQADEEKIRAQSLVREWHRSGFLNASQTAQLLSELRVDLRRTNFFLRAVLFLFTSVVIAAAVSLILTIAAVNADPFNGTICIVAALVCFAIAQLLIRQFRFYRFGIEEAFAVAAAILLSIGVALVAPRGGDFQFAAGLAVGALGFVVVFARYGYVYSAVAGLICAAAIPLPLVRSVVTMRVLAAVICTCTFLVARRRRMAFGDDFPGDDYAVIQASAWVGLYLALNLQLASSAYYQEDLIYWSTYAMTWVLPIVGFWLALPTKDRPLMNVSVLSALITLATNKSYLHLMRQPWDPILLGALLAGSAILTKRWLGKGTGGQRRGFTTVRLLASDRQAMNFVSTASTALQSPSVSAPVRTSEPDFGGGRSGGAGASGSF
jgi:hypothetical protein